MTRFKKDSRLRMRGKLQAFAIGLGLLLAHGAAAQVTLTNSVLKAEQVLNGAGQLERTWVEATSVVPGDELRYTITFTNVGGELIDGGSIVITNPIPESTTYLDGSASGLGTDIVFSVDGVNFASPGELMVEVNGSNFPAAARDYKTIRWVFGPELGPGEARDVTFDVRLK